MPRQVLRALDDSAIWWPPGPPRIHYGYQSPLGDDVDHLDQEAEESAARDLVAAAQAAGCSVIDLLATGPHIPPPLDTRLVTGVALIMEAEAGHGNTVAGVPLKLAGPPEGLAQLDALSQFDSGSGSDSPKPDTPSAANLASPGTVGHRVTATAYQLRTEGA
jgi:hypothetical protein